MYSHPLRKPIYLPRILRGIFIFGSMPGSPGHGFGNKNGRSAAAPNTLVSASPPRDNRRVSHPEACQAHPGMVLEIKMEGAEQRPIHWFQPPGTG